MITFKINGKSYDFPSSWEDLTYQEYCEIVNDRGDILQLVSMRSGLNYEIIKSATIIGLDQVITALSFMRKPPLIPGYTEKVGPYKLPATKDGKFDIQFESLAQFEDMRAIITKTNTNDVEALTASYGQYVAIYLQKIRDGQYDPDRAILMEEEVKALPALEVISAGSFFFLKLLSLLSGINLNSPKASPPPKRSKPASKGSPKRSASTAQSRKRR